ncbi:MAG: hypothetical protein WBR56_16220 [Sedimenticolaceae bacterium]
MNAPQHLELIERRWQSTIPVPELTLLGDSLMHQYGDAVAGILYYGSCLRKGDATEGLVDLYVIVEAYRAVYGVSAKAFFNWLLPPNVFYLELPVGENKVRAKYAILSLPQLQRGTRRWFQPYLWGRFAQPLALLRARNESTAQALLQAVGQAVITFMDATLPVLPARFSARDLWEQGLARSYRTELRAERTGRQAELYRDAESYYLELTAAALARSRFAVHPEGEGTGGNYVADIGTPHRRAARAAWLLRTVQGRLLHVMRLIKGLFTFSGGVDYVLWKLERHSGVRLEVSDRVRRHPLIFGWGLVWRLYRRGAFR